MGRIVGIDLGTTNSLIAAVCDGKPTIIRSTGNGITPSVVSFGENDTLLVGDQAKNQSVLSPKTTITSSKRFIGRNFSDVGTQKDRVAFSVVETESKGITFDLGLRKITPEEVGAFILRNLIEQAEEALGEEITDAIITVPAYFTDAQRKATEDAGKLAGIKVRRILNEPTAAALAFGLTHRDGGKIVVFDLGGGTFDVSLLEVGNNVWEVLATAGDNYLGGDDFDQKLLEWAVKETEKSLGVDIRSMPQPLQRLKVAVEQAKCALSTLLTTEISLPFLLPERGTNGHLQLTITRDTYDELTKELVERCRKPFLQVLSDAGLKAEEIDEVLLVGGSTRMPSIRALVKELSANRDPNASVNPEEVVALGAAVQAGILGGTVNDMVLLDVTPFSLGVLTGEDAVTPIIPRNSPVPTRRSEFFSTAQNFQRGVDVVILQGEFKSAKLNKELGRVELDGIKKMVKGDALIEVTFVLNENGILKVLARDTDTGQEKQLEISTIGNISRKELEKLAAQTKEISFEAKNKRNAAEVIAQAEYVKKKINDALQKLEVADKHLVSLLEELDKSIRKNVKSSKLENLCLKAEEVLHSKGF